LLEARDGDRRALRAFIDQTQDEVWRFLAHQVGPVEADDVTQDVYLRAWRALPAFRGEASARTWLLAIARRAGVDALRHRARRRRLSGRVAQVSDRHAVPDLSSAQALGALLESLAENRREAFVLTQLLGYSYRDAAIVCGVPVGTIRSRVARAREDLIGQLRRAQAS
jgi:RNA polymerase sigma-70 factor (ECF subfamily)